MEKCEICGNELNPLFRFTDWDNDSNDEYGSYDFCLKLFNQAVKEDPEGRYSIYDVSECPVCEDFKDEGVLFNEKCPVYATLKSDGEGMTIFEDFIEYCKEDNEELAKDIMVWLCDYFDLPNRHIPLTDDEKEWINANISKNKQTSLLGCQADNFNKTLPNADGTEVEE